MDCKRFGGEGIPMRVEQCGRCGSKIVEQHGSMPERFGVYRATGGNTWESNDITLCTMCLDDVWEFVFEEEIDRSDKADPMSIGRVSKSVERHKEELETLLSELENHD